MVATVFEVCGCASADRKCRDRHSRIFTERPTCGSDKLLPRLSAYDWCGLCGVSSTHLAYSRGTPGSPVSFNEPHPGNLGGFFVHKSSFWLRNARSRVSQRAHKNLFWDILSL
jgi:hypothetical protein